MIPKNKIIFILISALFFGSIFLFHFLDATPIISYTSVFIISSFIYLLISIFVFRLEFSSKLIYSLIFCALILRISFLATPVIGSDDIYRYMWDGKIQANGINPYLYAPGDPHLDRFHSDLLPKALNFKEMKTIYFPLSQWIFYAGYELSAETAWGYKLLLFLFELMTIAGIILLLKKMKMDPKFSLLYALSPLPIFQFAIDAHLDGFGLPLLLFAVYFYVDERKILSSLLLGLSLSIKPVGLLLLPIFFLNEKSVSGRIKIVILPLLAFFLQFIFYIFSTNPFEAFFIFTKNWYFNGFIFNLLNSFFANNQTSRLICALLLVSALIPLYFSKKEMIEKIYFAVLLLMIFSPVVHPWYIAWVAVLLPIARKGSGIYFTAMASLTSITILNYQLFGIWKDYWPVLAVEYLPVLILLFFELRGNNPIGKILSANPR